MRGTRIAWVRLLGLLVLLSGASRARAQAPSSELARQHLESGLQFYEQERYNQALNDFQIIVSSMGDTEYADDALLRIGQYYLEVEEDFAEAAKHFQTLLERYPTGDKAPGAYYYLGVVSLNSHLETAGVDDAMANFQRVIRLYPQSPFVPAALAATGAALERSGRWEEAIGAYYQVVSEHPNSAWAPSAQFAIGRSEARNGDPTQAMMDLQRVRNLYPDSEEAREALDFLTVLFRFYGLPELGRPVAFQVDPRFQTSMADRYDNVQAIRISPGGIHVLEEGRKRIVNLDWSGKLASTQSAAQPRGLSVDPRGTPIVANEKGLIVDGKPVALRVPEENGPKELEKVRAAARDRLGNLYVYDDDQKMILRFDSAGNLVGPFPDGNRREVLRLAVDPADNLVVLDNERTVTVFSPGGTRVASIERRAPRWELSKPVDVAIDPSGFLYVLDEDGAQLAVFDPSYQFVLLLTRQSLGGGALTKPITLDVDRAGDLYVYDDKTQSVIRLH
jgi:TolA-binding protein